MADKVEFELVSPATLLFSDAVDMVVVPGEEGDFAALPGHAPLISKVRPGVIDIHDEGAVSRRIFVAGGFAEVTQERCTVLAEEACPVESILLAEAEQRLDAAREAAQSADKTAAEDGQPAASMAARELLIAEALFAAASAREG